MQYMQIFTKYYEKLYSAISEKCDLDDSLDLSFELYPFLVVTGICSFMGLSSEVLTNGSNIFSEEILNPALNITSGSEKEFADRMDLYFSVIQGNPLRGDWCMGFIPPHLSSDLVMRCVIALGDIVLRPDCASSYFSDSSDPNNKTTIQTMKVFSVFAEEIPNIMNEYRNELQEKALESSDKTRIIKRKATSIMSSLDRIVQKIFSALSGMGGILLLLAFGVAALIGIYKVDIQTPEPTASPSPTMHQFSPPTNGRVLKTPDYECICPLKVSVQGENAYYVYLEYCYAPVHSVYSRTIPSGNGNTSIIDGDAENKTYKDLLEQAREATGEMGAGFSSNQHLKDDIAFYIAPNSTVEVDVPVGVYKLYYACGEKWYGLKNLFGEETVYGTSDDLLEFYTDYSSAYGNTLELWSQYDGNLDTEEIDASQFPK